MDGDQTVETTSSSKVILSIIGILVVAAVAFTLVRSNKGDTDMATTTNATSSEETAFSGNLFDLVGRGGDWKCAWSSTQEGVQLDGVVYVSRGKFKSDVEMRGAGVSAAAHALGDGEFVYSWSSLAPMGVKFPMSAGTTGVAAGGATAQNAQLTGVYSYDCDPWKAESGTFALPSGITFQTVTAPAAPQQ